MPTHLVNQSLRVGEGMAPLTDGAHDLTAQAGKPQRCARRVYCLTAVTISVLADARGVNCAPATALPAGAQLDADISAITFTGGEVLVFW